MDTENGMRILVVEPQKAPYEKQIENGLKPLQESVGGYIQAIYPFVDPVAIIVNVESLLMRSKKAKRPEIRAFCLT